MGADHDNHDNVDSLGQSALGLMQAWAQAIQKPQAAAEHTTQNQLINGVRDDADGFAFLRSILDSVIGTGDPFAAALGLREAASLAPHSLSARDRLLLRTAGVASLGLPWAVLPLARRLVRERVSDIVCAQRFPKNHADAAANGALSKALGKHTAASCETVLVLTGDPVLGENGIQSEIARLIWLTQQTGVKHVACDPLRFSAGLTPWSDERDTETAAQLLRPAIASAQEQTVSMTFCARNYRGALVAPELLVRAFADPAFNSVHVGISLPAELPESAGAADRLIRWSRARVREGGEPLTITIAHTSIAGNEQISSLITGLAVPTLAGSDASDAHMLRLLQLLLGAAHKGDVRLICATEDPHMLALAAAYAAQADLPDDRAFTLQLRAGISQEFVAALTSNPQTPPVRIELPITSDSDYTGLLEAVITVAAETCDAQSVVARNHAFVAAAQGAAASNTGLVNAAAPLETAFDAPYPPSHRTQRREREWDPSERDSALFYRPPVDEETFDTGGLTAAVLGLTRGTTGQILREPLGRAQPVPAITSSGFANEPITDALCAENREWVRRLLREAHTLRTEWDSEPPHEIDHRTSGEAIDELIAHSTPWRELHPHDRSLRIRRLAFGAAAARDRFFTVCAAETGSPVPMIDHEINGAIDAARSLAAQAAKLGTVRGATFHPDPVVLQIFDAGTPLDERAESLIAALAAGSAVLCVVHPSNARSTTALCEEWEAAGLPPGLIHIRIAIPADSERLAAAAVLDPRVTRALVIGQRTTAMAIQRARPGLRVDGRYCTLGSAGITPSADSSSAVRELVRSAFGATHNAASTARAFVLLGNANRAAVLTAQLEDAVRALRAGDTGCPELGGEVGADPLAFTVGPLVAAPSQAGLRALTVLHPGERWLVQPEALDSEWRLWSPGIRIGVKADSPFWADAVGMPVIGVASARTMPELITMQSHIGGGSVAALFAQDPAEVLPWLERIQAARVTVGHATTPAQVERNPWGGWGAAGSGAHMLSGGPHRLLGFGSWSLREGTQSSTLHLRGLAPEVQMLIETAQADLDYRTFDVVRRAALSDALAWRTDLGRFTDTVGLGVRHHFIRRRPVPTHIRLAERAPLGELVRVLAAGLLVNAPLTISTGLVLPADLSMLLSSLNIPVSLERDADWLERMSVQGPDEASAAHVFAQRGIPVTRTQLPDLDRITRIRLIGANAEQALEWLGVHSDISVWSEPVTMAGPLELLAFLNEQGISINAHQYGMAVPVKCVSEWIDELDWRVESPQFPFEANNG